MSESIASILILEDDPDVAQAAALLIRRRKLGEVSVLADPAGLAAALEQQLPDLVLLDFNFGPGRIDGAQGLALLDRLRALPLAPSVIAITAYADVALAVEALKRGAADFITKPWDNLRLAAAVDAALARRARGGGEHTGSMNAASRAMQEILRTIERVAPTEANVMLLGENGVGKELVARAIHQRSRRAAGTFLAVDLGALPESTFESELFGHRKGAFTDAARDRLGRFQAARAGSLFLDEIGNVSRASQAKLLTALERREVTPLGADQPDPIDVRIISATNLEETQLYDPKLFRPDLLFRINTIVIRVPPLRERSADIPALLAHFLVHYQQKYGHGARALSATALDALCRYPWPGNVRALRHACERAVIMSITPEYELADFSLDGAGIDARETQAEPDSLKLDALERTAIATALGRTDGSITEAAKLLGLSRAALYRKLDKHGL